MCGVICLMGGPDCSVAIAAAYGLKGLGSNPGGGEIFRTCPDWPLGPVQWVTVLSGGVVCKVLPGRDADPSPLLVPRLKYRRTIPLLSLRAFVACETVKPVCLMSIRNGKTI